MHQVAHDWDLDLAVTERMRPLAEPVVGLAVTEILEGELDVVGFITTFMQSVPSLARARELKRRRPGLRIVLFHSP